jgi:hypothetical protein
VLITERELEPLEIWPSADELEERRSTGALVLLPDDLSEIDGEMVASFRESAQSLRAHANEAGIPVEFAAPSGARLGVYRERAADWVLPYVLGIPSGVFVGLVVNEIQRILDRARLAGQDVTPTIRLREVVIEEGRTTVRELSGSGDDLLAFLQDRRRSLPTSSDDD